MNIKPIPIHNDYLNASSEDIIEGETVRLRTQIEMLRSNGNLCCEEGRELVSEFGFKGNMESVINQVENYIESISNTELCITDRIEILNRRVQASKSVHYEDKLNPYKEKFKKALEQGDVGEALLASENMQTLQKTLHEKKECLCYTNS